MRNTEGSINPSCQGPEPTNKNFNPFASINNAQKLKVLIDNKTQNNQHMLYGNLNNRNLYGNNVKGNLVNGNLTSQSVEIKPNFQENEKSLKANIVLNKNFNVIPYNCPNIWIFYVCYLGFQIIIIILNSFFFEFPDRVKSNSPHGSSLSALFLRDTPYLLCFLLSFPSLGLLFSLPRANGWSSLALSFAVGVAGLSPSLLFTAFWEATFVGSFKRRGITPRVLMKAAACSLTNMVTVGGLIGRLTFPQFLTLSLLESFFSSFNYALNIIAIKCIDDGGSLRIFCFGGIFAFGVSASFLCCGNKKKYPEKKMENGNYRSVYVSFLGSLIFFAVLPFINAGLAPLTLNYTKDSLAVDHIYSYVLRYRAVMSSFFSLLGSSLATLLASTLLSCQKKLRLPPMALSLFSGAIVVAGSAGINTHMYSSLLIGFFTGIISELFFYFLTPLLSSLSLPDPLSIFSAFSLPGFLGGILTSIFIAALDDSSIKSSGVFKERGLSLEAGIQVASCFITLLLSLIFGSLTGLLLYFVPLGELRVPLSDQENFDEEENEDFPEAEKMENVESIKYTNNTNNFNNRNFNRGFNGFNGFNSGINNMNYINSNNSNYNDDRGFGGINRGKNIDNNSDNN